MRTPGLMIILSSPSGAGKSTIARALMAENERMQFSVSATTRAPRPGEEDGREYFFRTKEAFEAMVAAGELIEHAEVFGNYYGTPRGPIEDAVADGTDVLLDIDWQGGQQVLQSPFASKFVSIFILPPSIAELERRLHARAADSDEVVAGRMARAWDEISHWSEYDYVLVNENLDQCLDQVRSIIAAERTRRQRQSGLSDFVLGLRKEFEARGVH